jgi:hypothetical protein
MPARVVALVLAALALSAAPARAAVPAGNLVVNPGAEAAAPPALPGWTVTAPFESVDYGNPGGFPASAPDGGLNFFAGGDAAESSATQIIDVSQAAAEIDAGTVMATLSALEGGFETQEDYATVTLRYLDASGDTIDLISLAPVTKADRGGDDAVTELLPRSDSGKVPAGTRALRVTIDAVRFAGSYDDGYADNVSVVLSGATVTPAPTPTPPPAPSPSPTPTPAPSPEPTPTFHQSVVAGVVSGTVRFRKPGSRSFVTLTADQALPLGSTLDTRHGVMTLSSVPRPGGAVQTTKFYAGLFRVTQPGGVTQLELTERLAPCGRASAAAKKPKTRRLWGDGGGSFRTKGQYSSATVRGTKWLVQDSCAGTLTKVVRGVVSVRDAVRHKTVILRAGKRYLARPRR